MAEQNFGTIMEKFAGRQDGDEPAVTIEGVDQPADVEVAAAPAVIEVEEALQPTPEGEGMATREEGATEKPKPERKKREPKPKEPQPPAEPKGPSKGDQRTEELYAYLVKYVEDHGCAPTMLELRDDNGFLSRASVNHHLHKLKQDDRITWLERTARGVVPKGREDCLPQPKEAKPVEEEESTTESATDSAPAAPAEGEDGPALVEIAPAAVRATAQRRVNAVPKPSEGKKRGKKGKTDAPVETDEDVR